ncbi:MAG: 50S ribosomal protein L30 [Nitrospirae bacterium]|nr:50S ribosomal protein L30 [Nitrospirota bacterium]
MKTIKITLKRSVIGKPEKQRRILSALGLKRPHQSVIHKDVPSVRGMVHKVSYMVQVSEKEEG